MDPIWRAAQGSQRAACKAVPKGLGEPKQRGICLRVCHLLPPGAFYNGAEIRGELVSSHGTSPILELKLHPLGEQPSQRPGPGSAALQIRPGEAYARSQARPWQHFVVARGSGCQPAGRHLPHPRSGASPGCCHGQSAMGFRASPVACARTD